MAVQRPSRRLHRRRLFFYPLTGTEHGSQPRLTTRDRELVSVLKVRIEPGDLNPRPLTPESVTIPTLPRAAFSVPALSLLISTLPNSLPTTLNKLIPLELLHSHLLPFPLYRARYRHQACPYRYSPIKMVQSVGIQSRKIIIVPFSFQSSRLC